MFTLHNSLIFQCNNILTGKKGFHKSVSFAEKNISYLSLVLKVGLKVEKIEKIEKVYFIAGNIRLIKRCFCRFAKKYNFY